MHLQLFWAGGGGGGGGELVLFTSYSFLSVIFAFIPLPNHFSEMYNFIKEFHLSYTVLISSFALVIISSLEIEEIRRNGHCRLNSDYLRKN